MKRLISAVSGPLIAFIASSVIACGTCAAAEARSADAGAADDSPIVELRKDAEQGNVKAQYVLGCCYNGEHGFVREPAKAAKWWGVAAANGYADAQFCLGLSCFMGEGVPKSSAEAIKWWQKAADQDNPDAQYFLGLSYHTGLGVPKSTPLAVYWLQRSANHEVKAAAELLKEITVSSK